MKVINLLLSIIQVLLSIALIYVIDRQNPKNEGIGGSIGGSVQSSFKGKTGFDERLNELTRVMGYGFFVVSILVALTMNR